MSEDEALRVHAAVARVHALRVEARLLRRALAARRAPHQHGLGYKNTRTALLPRREQEESKRNPLTAVLFT